MSECRWGTVRFCPLYWAGHDAEIGAGCYPLDPDKCSAHRKKVFDREMIALSKKRPLLIIQCTAAEIAFEARAQRERNMKLLGIR